MLRAIILVSIAACVIAQDVNDASQQCFSTKDRRNPKDVYPDTTDCHYYIQCFYMNETFAVGFRRKCPANSFWHEAVLACLPEGPTPCVDRCMNDATATRGCYAGLGCRQFYVCANTGSYGMCCPIGTQFNEATCSCDESTTCGDACVQQGPITQTTVAPAQAYNATVCIDSFGVYIAADAAQSNAFHTIDDEGQSSGTQYCVAGYSFNLVTCRCDIESGATVPPQLGLRRATAYLPFDADTKDYSINKFSTFAVGGAQYTTDQYAVGAGSLYVNGGHVEVPGLKTFDSRTAASWCAFYRCTGTCTGGILTNGRNEEQGTETAILGFLNNALTTFIYLVAPQGTQNLVNPLPTPNGWHHVCITYDGNTFSLYNDAAVTSVNVGGYLQISHSPLAIGNDQGFGTFNGYIDEVLITPFSMTTEEVQAHRNGDRAFLKGKGFW